MDTRYDIYRAEEGRLQRDGGRLMLREGLSDKKGDFMQDIYIIGAGGFGREVQWLIERINGAQERWRIKGYLDDNLTGMVNDYPVVDTVDGFIHAHEGAGERAAVACAIGNSRVRRKLIAKLKACEGLDVPNLIDPSVLMSERVEMGEGNIICAGNILTVNIRLGSFNIINLDCTIGHDVVTEDFVTLYPSVNVSGAVTIGACTEIGTGAHLIQGLSIGRESTVGAGSVVIRDIPASVTAVGNPAHVIKS